MRPPPEHELLLVAHEGELVQELPAHSEVAGPCLGERPAGRLEVRPPPQTLAGDRVVQR